MKVKIPGRGKKGGASHYPSEDWREIAVPWEFPARMGIHHAPLVEGPWEPIQAVDMPEARSIKKLDWRD